MKKNLIVLLKKQKLTLSLAESCTAGYVSYLLAKIPGTSLVYKGGIVIYSLDSKTKFFQIPPPLLKKTQGVSKEIALTLAKKIRLKFKTDIGASVVGFAGPTGLKVGTVFIAVSLKNKTVVKKHILKGTRDVVRKKAASLLIDFVYKNIK